MINTEQERTAYTKTPNQIAIEAIQKRQEQAQLNKNVASLIVAQSHIKTIRQKLAATKVATNRFQETIDKINKLGEYARYCAESARLSNERNKAGA